MYSLNRCIEKYGLAIIFRYSKNPISSPIFLFQQICRTKLMVNYSFCSKTYSNFNTDRTRMDMSNSNISAYLYIRIVSLV